MILMDLNEQTDRDFGRALRKAWLRRMVQSLRGGRNILDDPPTFDEARKSLRAYNQVQRGLRVVDPGKIVGSVGRQRDFDRWFMPLRAAAGNRWRHVDHAFYRDKVLPPVSLFKLGDSYFVRDGNHRVSVARFHGMPAIEANVTELKTMFVEDRDTESSDEAGLRAA